MAKLCKKSMLLIVLALCLIGCFVLVACDKDPVSVTYSVTVTDDADRPVNGVSIEIAQGNNTYDAKTTDENGKVTFDMAKNDYDILIDEDTLPEHYCVPEGANLKLTKDNNSLTVKLARKFAYVIKLVNPDGTPFYNASVSVGVCYITGTECKTPVSLDANGVAYVEDVEKDNYRVQILNLPTGYAFEGMTATNHYYTGETFSATKTEMTITIYPVTAINFDGTAMNDDAKNAFLTANSFGANSEAAKSIKASTSYKFSKEIAAGTSAYFALNAPMSGEYYVIKKADTGLVNKSLSYLDGNDGEFKVDVSTPLSSDISKVIMTKGTVHYVKITNNSNEAKTAEFVITCPDASKLNISNVINAENVTVTINKSSAYAIIAFTPSQAGQYTLTTKGNDETLVEVSDENADKLNKAMEGFEGKTFAPRSSKSAKITSDRLVEGKPHTLYFAIAAKDVTEPVDIMFSITQTKRFTAVAPEVISPSETLTAFSPEKGTTLTKVPMTTAASEIVEGDDGYYHIGSKTGPVVVVNLTKPLSLMKNVSIAYSTMDNVMLSVTLLLDVTSDSDKKNPEKDNSFKDYRLFIRGFNDFNEKWDDDTKKMIYSIPSTLDSDNCYAKYVNADGVYPLNEELKLFLKDFYANNSSLITADASNGWMFALYYYKEVSGVDTGIVGNYKLYSKTELDGAGNEITTPVDGDNLYDDDYLLNVLLNGTFEIEMYGMDELFAKGDWTNNENGTYTFAYTDYDTTVTVTFSDNKITVRVPENITMDQEITLVFVKSLD